MSGIPINQWLFFGAEAVIIALLVLFLFRIRSSFGLSPLYITLGVFQPIQVLLASSVYAEILPGVVISPGSVIMFTASLFAVLLVYIREDALETRKVIYGIMLANLTMTLLLYIFGMQLGLADTLNFLSLPREIFSQNARVMLTGTLSLFADVLLIIFVYEMAWRLIKKNLFLRIYLTMAVVLAFDSLAFATGAFYGQPNYGAILTSGLIGKLGMAVFYAFALTLYLRFAEPGERLAQPFEDIFYALTYRQKYQIERQRGVQAGEELKNSEARYRDLVETAQDLIWQCDVEGRYTYLNPAGEEVFGYKIEEMLGKRFVDFQTPEYAERDMKAFARLLQGNTVKGLETVHIGKDGREIHLVFNAKFLVDEQGNAAGTRGTAYDITKRVRTEEALHALSTRQDAILAAVPDIITEVDKDKVYTWANPAGLEFFGEDAIGKEAAFYFEGEQDTYGVVQHLFNGSENVIYLESWQRRKDGEKRLLAWWCRVLKDSEGNVTGALSTARDITERKRAEEELRKSENRWRSLVQNAPNVIFTVGRDERITFINYVLPGFDINQVIGQSVYEFIQPESTDVMRRAFERVFATGESETYELVGHGPQGEPAWYSNRVGAIKQDGEVVSLVVISSDITERKQAEDEIHRRTGELTALLKSSQELATTLDLGTVLQTTTDSVTELMELQSAAIYLLEGETLYLGATSPALPPQFPEEFRRASLADHPHIHEAITTGLPVFLSDSATADLTPAERAVSEVRGLRSILYLPLLAGAKVVGTLIVASVGEPRAISEAEIDVCRTLSNLAALAVENAQLFESIQRHVTQLGRNTVELAALNALGRDVSLSLSIDEVISTGLHGMLTAVNPDVAFFFLREGERLIQKSIVPSEAKVRLGDVPEHRVGECMCGLAVREKKAMYSRDIFKDLRCTWEECKKAGMRSFAALPLLSGGEVIGIIGLASDEERDFEAQAEFLETLTSTVAVGMSNALFYEQIQQYANELEARVAERTTELTERMAEVETLNQAMIALTEDLQIAVTKAESADRLKSAFLATMSHELRTPLNSIIGFSGIILQGLAGPLNPEQDKQLNMVYDSARHLLALINDVLDISKIEAGQLEIAAEPFDVRQAIESALQTVTPLAEKKGLALVAEVSPEVGQITSDRRRVEQILINLVNNAIKFTDAGQVTVTTELLSAIENRPSQIRIQVADTGIGIKPENMGKLFKPFQQVETGLARSHEGTGLGLSICQRLVELLGGEIWVESQWGVGSSFIFTLPLRRRNG